MKTTLMAAAAVALSLAAAPAFAQDAPASDVKVYGSLGFSTLGDDFVTLGGAQARLGFRGAHFGIEGEGMVGVLDDSGIELDSQLAIYAVGFMPVSDNVEFIARVGYGTFEVSAGGASGDAQTTNIGVGGQYNMDEHNGFRADFTYMIGDGNAYMAGLSYVRTF